MILTKAWQKRYALTLILILLAYLLWFILHVEGLIPNLPQDTDLIFSLILGAVCLEIADKIVNSRKKSKNRLSNGRHNEQK